MGGGSKQIPSHWTAATVSAVVLLLLYPSDHLTFALNLFLSAIPSFIHREEKVHFAAAAAASHRQHPPVHKMHTQGHIPRDGGVALWDGGIGWVNGGDKRDNGRSHSGGSKICYH